MLSRFLALTALALLLSAPALSAQENDSGYTLEPGDKIEVKVFTAAGEKISVVEGERILDRNGDVFLPYVGTVRVSGMDQDALRQLLSDGYSRFYSDPVVDVVVRLRVNVTGAVGNPGQLFLDPTATILDAVTAAGGMGPEIAVASIQIPADQSKVRLVRGGVTQTLNLRADDVRANVLAMHVKSGDWIHVPYRGRSRVRDEIQFWGGVTSFAASIAGLIVLIAR